MAIVDERGRLFGRLNLLDAIILVLLLGLIPLGYAAYALFREPPVRITAITPSSVQEQPQFRVVIRGENLRPYMRISLGNLQALDFLFNSSTEAEVEFVGVPSGTYDVVLYDQRQEQFRLPNALIVSPSALPGTEMVAVGAFGNLDAAGAARIVAGMPLARIGTVTAVASSRPDVTKVFSGSALVAVPAPNALRVPAVVRLGCAIRTLQGRPDCVVGNVTVAPNQLMVLPTPNGDVPFQIEQVRSAQPVEPVAIRVRLAGHPEVLALIRPGDADYGGTSNELAAGATVAGVGPLRRSSEGTGDVDANLVAHLQPREGTWLYDSQPLRVGSPFTLRTARYLIHGTVTQMPPVPAQVKP